MLTKDSIKQFLKSDRRKIVITVFPVGFISFVFFIFLFDVISLRGADITEKILNSKAGFLVLILFTIFFSYIVSCFIIEKLKPTRKILLSFFLLFIIAPIIYAFSSYCVVIPNTTCDIQRISILGIELSESIIWFISIILSYLFSSLLISAWDKIRKKPVI